MNQTVRSPDALALPLAYVKRESAMRQAAAWNVAGPTADGRIVAVGPRVNGRYPLIWVTPTN
jgi:hypothetical protein